MIDYGLRGRAAIVCGSSHGLGRGCALELARAGCTVLVNGRDPQGVEAAAAQLREETAGQVLAVAADVTTREGQDALLAALPRPDILVTNAAGPPYRDFRAVDREAMEAGLRANMIAPIELVQRVVDGMVERRFGRIVNITSGSVRAPLPGLDLSSGARLGLTGFLAGVARTVAHANVTINCLLPGSFDTRRLRSLHEGVAARRQVSFESVRAELRDAIPAKRFGQPSEFGAACAFLCSVQAGFITGQSLLVDGGAFPGVM